MIVCQASVNTHIPTTRSWKKPLNLYSIQSVLWSCKELYEYNVIQDQFDCQWLYYYMFETTAKPWVYFDII